jgi:hypothetical protein
LEHIDSIPFDVCAYYDIHTIFTDKVDKVFKEMGDHDIMFAMDHRRLKEYGYSDCCMSNAVGYPREPLKFFATTLVSRGLAFCRKWRDHVVDDSNNSFIGNEIYGDAIAAELGVKKKFVDNHVANPMKLVNEKGGLYGYKVLDKNGKPIRECMIPINKREKFKYEHFVFDHKENDIALCVSGEHGMEIANKLYPELVQDVWEEAYKIGETVVDWYMRNGCNFLERPSE